MILPGGTAYLTDAGMCGDYNSVIGMDKEEPMRRFVTGMPKARFTPAAGDATLSGFGGRLGDDATADQDCCDRRLSTLRHDLLADGDWCSYLGCFPMATSTAGAVFTRFGDRLVCDCVDRYGYSKLF